MKLNCRLFVRRFGFDQTKVHLSTPSQASGAALQVPPSQISSECSRRRGDADILVSSFTKKYSKRFTPIRWLDERYRSITVWDVRKREPDADVPGLAGARGLFGDLPNRMSWLLNSTNIYSNVSFSLFLQRRLENKVFWKRLQASCQVCKSQSLCFNLQMH